MTREEKIKEIREVIRANYADGKSGGMLTTPYDLMEEEIAEIIYYRYFDEELNNV